MTGKCLRTYRFIGAVACIVRVKIKKILFRTGRDLAFSKTIYDMNESLQFNLPHGNGS